MLNDEQRKRSALMLRDATRIRVRSVNQSDREAWSRIQTRADWEKSAVPRLQALRSSLGIFPPPPRDLQVQTTRSFNGDGYQIENLLFQSRLGLLVTANLYAPLPRRDLMPGIVIVHSHHNPKTQGELQDMGMTWARQGCLVLVMDQLSYGERRQHAAGNRQDYRFRYINGLQLHVIGDSLMGWMVWDIMRGIDLLHGRVGIDKSKIILIGSVAGGGDPAAVAAALDTRITCAVPFNFGGPQPETTYPLPAQAEETFNYLGGGSWESTRNLRRSGSGGFLPWTLVGAVAPRRLIYAHEFSWDRERDPVWKRLQKVFSFYDAAGNLDFAHGGGLLQGQPPEATHCNNVGAVHRKMIHPALERWFGIRVPQEYQQRRPPEDLMCLTPEIKARPLHEIYSEIGADRANAFRAQLNKLNPNRRRALLRERWAGLLGEIEPRVPRVLNRTSERIVFSSSPARYDGPTHPFTPPRRGTDHRRPELSSPPGRGTGVGSRPSNKPSQIYVERILLESEPGITLPLLLALPQGLKAKPPVVVAVAQHGKAQFLAERAETIAELLESGIAVCLPDVRGTGETSVAGSRQARSEATSISATELMLSRTLLGARLQDLRSILRYLQTRDDLAAKRLALWGDSFASTNPKGFSDPLIDEGEAPRRSEPVGGLLALFGALFEDDVRAVFAGGTLAGFQAVVRDRFCYVPHDSIVPGALTAGDLSDVASALAPRPLRLARLVDGRNVGMTADEVRPMFGVAHKAYARARNRFLLLPSSESDLASWLSHALASRQ
ncbi:MAG: acetylxylan esterase [Verrucomicrobia bacterium]|nr:acetylxylan esterase [Verrucomicrobiota bacterium]